MTLKLVSDRSASPQQAAAAWAARLDRGELDAEEGAAFESWLDEPGNADAYADAAASLLVFDGHDLELPELAALRAEALAPASAREDGFGKASPKRMRWMPWAGGALAASIVAALLVLGQPALLDRDRGERPQIAASGERAQTEGRMQSAYRTAVGQQRTIELADGSKVTLNTDTEIAVEYKTGQRNVRLVRGQALFDVAHAPNRPFSVIVGGRKVTALGTVFEVRLDRDRLKVTLMRGKVRVDEEALPEAGKAMAPLAVLMPGQQFVAVGTLAPLVEQVDVEKQLLWRRSLIEFEGETLGEAVAELNRYSTTKMVISDSRAASLRMSGVIRTGDPDEFIELVGAMLPVTSQKNSRGEIELSYAP